MTFFMSNHTATRANPTEPRTSAGAFITNFPSGRHGHDLQVPFSSRLFIALQSRARDPGRFNQLFRPKATERVYGTGDRYARAKAMNALGDARAM